MNTPTTPTPFVEPTVDAQVATPAFKLQMNDRMPSNWDIKNHPEEADWVQATSLVTGVVFNGPVKELCQAWKA